MAHKIFHLEKITISNFRSIGKNITLHNLDDITVLIGPNGGGKSNVLRAIHWSFSNDKLLKEDIPSHLQCRKLTKMLISSYILKVIDNKEFNEMFLQKLKEKIELEERIQNLLKESKIQSVKYIKVNKYSDGTKRYYILDKDYKPINQEIQKDTKDYIRYHLVVNNQEIENRLLEIFAKGLYHSIEEEYLLESIDYKEFQEFLLKNGTTDELIKKLQNKITTLKSSLMESEKPLQDLENIEKEWSSYIKEFQIPPKDITFTVVGIRKTVKLHSLFDRIKDELISIFNPFNEEEFLFQFFDKILPKVIFLSQEMEIKDFIEKTDSWKDSITKDENTSIYYRLFSILDIDLDSFENENIPTQNRILNNALIYFSKELQEKWKQESLRIRANVAEKIISFEVYDLDEQNNELLVCPPSLRSRGFKWYLSYFITLKYVEKQGNAILLLDDPAVFLHERGQKDFLKSIEDVARNNQVFYTTHLISLFDENNLERIILVTREGKGKNTKISKPWNSTGYHVISPIYHALGFDQLIFNKSDKILFVEGISDKFILEGIKMHAKELVNYYIHPISGGNRLDNEKIVREMKFLRCVNHYKNIKPIFVLDGDRRRLFTNKTDNENIEEKEIIFLGNEEQEIEDLINTEFYLNAVLEYYSGVFSDTDKLTKLKKIISKVKTVTDNKKQITKQLEGEFKKYKLGNFSKVGVSIKLKKLLQKQQSSIRSFKDIKDIIIKNIR